MKKNYNAKAPKIRPTTVNKNTMITARIPKSRGNNKKESNPIPKIIIIFRYMGCSLNPFVFILFAPPA